MQLFGRTTDLRYAEPHERQTTRSPGARPTAGWTAAPSSDLGWALGVLSRSYVKAVAATFADVPGGPRGYQVLAAAARDEHGSQLALAQHLGVDRTVMTYLLDSLAEAGLIERRPDPADRRARRIVATARGRAPARTASASGYARPRTRCWPAWTTRPAGVPRAAAAARGARRDRPGLRHPGPLHRRLLGPGSTAPGLPAVAPAADP